MGLAYPLSRFSVEVLPPAGFKHLAADEPDWHILSFQPFDNAWAAICSHTPLEDIQFFNYEREQSN